MLWHYLSILFIINCVLIDCENPDNYQKSKLQIGIKKRMNDCSIRTKKGDLLDVYYIGSLENGTEFDNNYDRKQSLTFTLGSAQVIKGWDQGLIGMCIGEVRKLVIPPELAFGKLGAPPKIPPDSTLTFEVFLTKFTRHNGMY